VRHGGHDMFSFRIFEARIIGTLPFSRPIKNATSVSRKMVCGLGNFFLFPGSRWCGSRRRRVG